MYLTLYPPSITIVSPSITSMTRAVSGGAWQDQRDIADRRRKRVIARNRALLVILHHPLIYITPSPLIPLPLAKGKGELVI